jgi:hypothetical protein
VLRGDSFQVVAICRPNPCLRHASARRRHAPYYESRQIILPIFARQQINQTLI